MKKYVLIGNASGIGGWQLYNEARICYLSKVHPDYKLYLICSSESDRNIKLKGFFKAKVIYCGKAFRPPYIYSEKQKKKIFDQLITSLEYAEGDEVFVESTNIDTSIWGEMIAQRTNGTNYSYVLQSYIPEISKSKQQFMKYKYDRGLLSGMSKLTVPDILKGECEVGEDVRMLRASWNPPLCDDGDLPEEIGKYLSEKNNVKVIGYFGNLTKPNFLKLCSFIEDYCQKRADMQFLFLSIGSSGDHKSEDTQLAINENVKNCRSFNIPSLYPVPRSFFKKMDCCIASWGSSSTAARAGTISVRLTDDVGLEPHGIIGVNLLKEPYYEQPKCGKDLAELLDEILIEGKYKQDHYCDDISEADNEERQKLIDITLNAFNREKTPPYDVSRIKCVGMRDRMRKISNCLIGTKKSSKLFKYVKKLRKES